MSENGVYSQWNSHLIGIMISKTSGFRGTLFSDKPKGRNARMNGRSWTDGRRDGKKEGMNEWLTDWTTEWSKQGMVEWLSQLLSGPLLLATFPLGCLRQPLCWAAFSRSCFGATSFLSLSYIFCDQVFFEPLVHWGTSSALHWATSPLSYKLSLTSFAYKSSISEPLFVASSFRTQIFPSRSQNNASSRV